MKAKLSIFACMWVLMSVRLLAAAPVVKSGFFTSTDGVRLHYLESGKGQALVFVPGWTMPAEIWEPQIRFFAEHYRVVAFDPRSQGESAQTTEGHYPDRRAQDIKELVEQLNLAPAVVVGWSMGVHEILSYVDRFGTSSLRAIVLVDGFIGDDLSPQQIAGRWAFLKRLQLNRIQATEQFVRRMYKKPQPEGYYKKIIAAALRTPTNTAVTLLCNEYAGGDWRPVLPKLDRPVLYVAARRLTAQTALLKTKVPSSRVELFEQAGHALFVDEPKRFNKLLHDFLNGVSSHE